MIYIDLPADLNIEDDEGRNFARRSEVLSQTQLEPGVVLVAGAPSAWSWAQVAEVDEQFVYFRQITARQAAAHASLVVPLPRPA